MHTAFNRRTASKVKNGRVQRKHRHQFTTRQGYVLDRESPGRGFRHAVTKREVQAFIDIIPEWERLSERLERIILASECEAADGQHAFHRREETGTIWLHAWPEDLWRELSTPYFEAHADIFQRFGVSHDRLKTGVLCRFTEPQARAFMLLHVFLHELGHHHDRIHQKHFDAKKGEDHAERFATSRFEQLFPAYVRVFGHPARTV